MLGSLESYSTLHFLFLCLSYGVLVKAHTFIYAGCSQEKYGPNLPFEGNLNSFLSSVVTSSSQVSYNAYAVGNGSSTSPEGTVYGLYQCRGDLQTADCSKCMVSAISQIGLLCPYSYGASLQLEGCYLRYERASFLGMLDTSLEFKKCSKSVENDVEFFRRRDDVLADLQAGVGFKVSSSGMVEGFAQCLGDLSSTDCSSCIGDAVGKLKTLCGSAASADIFLGQCYARYWASGHYEEFSPDHKDDNGKTVAIIVGTLAGLAVVIVLLSFCRAAPGNVSMLLLHIINCFSFLSYLQT
ncbi:plasmodesmata-located protein 8 [Hibiscus trionum]|uniref:Plasmodesmata-located protein 8 n=1 Tax=Hibiscus trionum TaxID=183268 RepID=A0A9W7HEI6_HIBTR|nr:plasmodesmata-located protein 8 [Hibiscus trionum]